jgi:putative transposase
VLRLIMARPRRLPGFCYTGMQRYSFTFCTRQRRRAFAADSTVAAALTRSRQSASEQHFALLAFCVMPDHVHLLIEGLNETSDLQRFAKLAKQRSGADYACTAGEPLWQEGYYEHVLRGDEDAREVARYILENPVRAGLVSTPCAYPHLGSDVWTLQELMEGVE